MSESNDTVTAEVWKPIPGFEGAFDASSHGRVRANRRYSGTRWYESRVMRTIPLKSGYLKINLSHRGRIHQRRVHQLILESFVGPCPKGMECRHGDGNRSNNRLSNLSWGTRLENMADRDAHGTTASGERSGRAKLNWAKVREMRSLASAGVGTPEIARRIGVSRYVAWGVVTNRKWVE